MHCLQENLKSYTNIFKRLKTYSPTATQYAAPEEHKVESIELKPFRIYSCLLVILLHINMSNELDYFLIN